MKLSDVKVGQVVVVQQGIGVNGKSKELKGTVNAEPIQDEARFGNKLFHVQLKLIQPKEWVGRLRFVPIHRLEIESNVLKNVGNFKQWNTKCGVNNEKRLD